MLVKFVLLLFCYIQLIVLGSAVREFTPAAFPAKIFSQCGQHNPLNNDKQLLDSLQQVKKQFHFSCKSIFDASASAPSGYYHINATNGSLVQVYCDMEGIKCGGEGGWTRIAYVNMTQTGATCPMELNPENYNNKPYCGNYIIGDGCSTAVFPTLVQYSRVCGRVRGYQIV